MSEIRTRKLTRNVEEKTGTGAARKDTGVETSASGKPQRPGSGVALMVLLGLTVGALGHVAVHIKKVQTGYALGAAQRAEQSLLREKRALELELGVLKDPRRVIRRAQDDLQMGPPAPQNIFVLKGTAAGGDEELQPAPHIAPKPKHAEGR